MALIKKSKALVAAAAVLALAAAFALAGCGSNGSSSAEDTTLVVGATPAPHAEILTEAVAPILAEQGITLEVREFTDYVLPNTATEQGEIDANYFQHITYLNSFNEENGTHLVDVASIHFEPFGLYPGRVDSLDALTDGSVIAVPNDTTNEARALLLLQQEGLIELAEGAGITATVADIVSNPLNLQIRELESAIIPTVLADVDVACINGNYAVDAGISLDSALAVESTDSLAAETYANVLVVREGNENNDAIKALAAAMTSDEVRDYITSTYGAAVVPVF